MVFATCHNNLPHKNECHLGPAATAATQCCPLQQI